MTDPTNPDENPHEINPETGEPWPIEPLCCSFHYPEEYERIQWGLIKSQLERDALEVALAYRERIGRPIDYQREMEMYNAIKLGIRAAIRPELFREQ